MTATTEEPGVFLLGVGAQKAGTSWLHAQLNRRSDSDFGFLKEYHVHDALTLPAAGFSHRRRRSLLKPRTWRRQRFLDRPERYYAYFARRLKRRHIRLTGDITPSYSGLSASTLSRIRQGFAAHAGRQVTAQGHQAVDALGLVVCQQLAQLGLLAADAGQVRRGGDAALAHRIDGGDGAILGGTAGTVGDGAIVRFVLEKLGKGAIQKVLDALFGLGRKKLEAHFDIAGQPRKQRGFERALGLAHLVDCRAHEAAFLFSARRCAIHILTTSSPLPSDVGVRASKPASLSRLSI